MATEMTRDEQRAACIEAMEDAFIDNFYIKKTSPAIRKHVRESITAAFDALHGLAYVNPIEATEEMIAAGVRHRDNSQGGLGATFGDMSAVGDLTKAPERKT